MPNEDTNFLKTKVEILSFFNEDQLRKVTPDIERHTYSKGAIIILKGEATNSFYIIKRGKVAVLIKPKQGPQTTQELGAGDFFGEISLLEETTATASVRAIEDETEILMIPHGSFEKLLEMQPLLKKALLDKIAVRKSASSGAQP